MSVDAPGTSRPSRALRWAGIAVSVVSLSAIVVWASRQEAPQLPSSAQDLGALVAALALYAVATALRGERWRVLLLEAGGRPSRSDCHGLTIVSYGANAVLPARAGDVLRVALLPREAGVGRRAIVGTLLVERLADMVCLLAVFALLAWGAIREAGGDPALPLILFGGGVVLLGLVASALALWRAHPRVARLIDLLRPVVAPLAALKGRHLAEVSVATVAIWACEGVVWWAAAQAAGVPLSVVDAYALIGLAAMFALVPAGPGYAGTLDAALLLGIEALGGGAGPQAVAYIVLLRFVLFVPITIAGLTLLLARYGGIARARALVSGRGT